jgi:hypothetical protein
VSVTLEDLALDPWRIEAGLPTAEGRMMAELRAELDGAMWGPEPKQLIAYQGLAAWLPSGWTGVVRGRASAG